MENKVDSSPTIIQTDTLAKDGQNKCPKCGATDISLNEQNGKLRCNYCRFEFDSGILSGMVSDISLLEGEVIASGATDILGDTSSIITLKCSSCGAEVVIDTKDVPQARCHWCRNMLSINHQVPNGSVPDVVLPFGIPKEDAKKIIEDFVKKRSFFAHPKFKEEFSVQNIMGVYFPYMLVDCNAHATFSGTGEHLNRVYYRGTGENRKTYYDADLYKIVRDFDVTVCGLSVESSFDKLSHSLENTNNVINAIMPFDIQNCVRFNANYLNGYTSEKRDANIDVLKPLVNSECKDVIRFACNDTIKNYDRGVLWEQEDVAVKGMQWKSAYLPVWLYSYLEVRGEEKILHYVAVNGRTKEVMGSIPIYYSRLFLVSLFIEILGILVVVFIDFEYNWLFLLSGFIFFLFMLTRYRNQNARHHHETETQKEVSNLATKDEFIETRTGLMNARMIGANNEYVSKVEVPSSKDDLNKQF